MFLYAVFASNYLDFYIKHKIISLEICIQKYMEGEIMQSEFTKGESNFST